MPAIGSLGHLDRGLRIAKVFRNKEGHGVLATHTFDPQNYRDVELSIATLYARGFCQVLQIQFSVGKGEKGLWNLKHGTV